MDELNEAARWSCGNEATAQTGEDWQEFRNLVNGGAERSTYED